jgi:hypothetical protein
MNQDNTWKQTISFYEDLLAEGWDIKPQLELVKELAKTDSAKSFYPSISHSILCLSAQESYEEGQMLPMISIDYRGDLIFKIQFWKRPARTHDVITYEVNSTEVRSILEALFLRYKNTENQE